MQLFDHDKFLFVAFEQGAKGHSYCRTLATLDDTIYWYSCKENGVTPADFSINKYSKTIHRPSDEATRVRSS